MTKKERVKLARWFYGRLLWFDLRPDEEVYLCVSSRARVLSAAISD